jgi:hypothetical protein
MDEDVITDDTVGTGNIDITRFRTIQQPTQCTM